MQVFIVTSVVIVKKFFPMKINAAQFVKRKWKKNDFIITTESPIYLYIGDSDHKKAFGCQIFLKN